MDNNGLNDEMVQEYLQEIGHSVDDLRNGLPDYVTYRGRFKQKPLQVALSMRNDIKRVVEILSDYETDQ